MSNAIRCFASACFAPRGLAVVIVALAGVTSYAAAFRAAAQPGSLVFSGSVFDGTGAVLPQVDLTLEDAAHNSANARTDASGRFAFAPVAPGRYVLQATLAGFNSLRQEFELSKTADWRQAITLQVGTLQETISITASRQQSTATAPPVKIGGNLRAPRKLVDVRPDYPAAMRAGGFEGLVRLEALIDRNGMVSSVHALTAQVHPDLVKSAETAVRKWQFEPVLLNGEPVEALMTVAVRFSLE